MFIARREEVIMDRHALSTSSVRAGAGHHAAFAFGTPIEIDAVADRADDATTARGSETARRMTTTRILVLGGGFGGVAATREIERLFRDKRDVEITLVSRDNFF